VSRKQVGWGLIASGILYSAVLPQAVVMGIIFGGGILSVVAGILILTSNGNRS
jgi:hypothetical protein